MLKKIALIMSFGLLGAAANAASIVMVQNSTVGQFISSSGSALTSGGVSVGYFTGAEPRPPICNPRAFPCSSRHDRSGGSVCPPPSLIITGKLFEKRLLRRSRFFIGHMAG